MANNDVLIFQVTNTATVESGCAAHFIFDKNGGTLGSGSNNHWVIQDHLNNLPQDLARVEWRDKHYCILILGQAMVFINQSPITPKSGFIRLTQGDMIKLGEINIKVYIEDESQLDLETLSLKPEEIINGNEDHIKTLIGEQSSYVSKYKESIPALNDSISSDPLMVLSDESHNLLNEQHDQSITESITATSLTSSSLRSDVMNSNTHFMDLPNLNTNPQSEYIENAYVTISPLLREVGTQIALQNSQDINDILMEIGKTLKATVTGLLSLQKEQNNLSDKHLRPIEDNPLRLNLDYTSTMNILFGNEKSPVHLAAPAAVSESLHNLLLHNEANRIAIVSALTAILQAFSPTTLLERFENYRRCNELNDSNSSWAWEMYKNYYQELTSTRQKGFEKLFWEVYAQAYDKALRESHNK